MLTWETALAEKSRAIQNHRDKNLALICPGSTCGSLLDLASAHGRIIRRGKKLFYNDREIKLWGTCLGYADSKPGKAEDEGMAAFSRKFGFNALRHHKHLEGHDRQGFQTFRQLGAI